MKILMVNKFLYPNGGSETYMFKLGEYLESKGHEVQYFGMDHENRCVGNASESYTSNMDFHNSKLKKIIYPFKIIYSREARRKIRSVLDDFNPDVVHLNNFNFQLTPSIIYEIRKYEKAVNRSIRIVFTAHDYQLVCPNHMMNNPNKRENCEKCLNGNFSNCIKGKCIHGSTMKSCIGAIEGYLYKNMKTYRNIDSIICPSEFLANKLNNNNILKDKTIVLHNFIDKVEYKNIDKEDYILYFGRFSYEKGIATLLKVCKELKDIKFIFAGSGPLEDEIKNISNIKNVGFKSGEELEFLIRKAKFSIYPSEWYENCPFSVIESQALGTPVLASDLGGTKELIEKNKTGRIFKAGDIDSLVSEIKKLWNNKETLQQMSVECLKKENYTIDIYCNDLMGIYGGAE